LLANGCPASALLPISTGSCQDQTRNGPNIECGIWNVGKKRAASLLPHIPYSTFDIQRPALLRGEALGDRVPVDDVPPRIDVVGALVLVLQVIRVLPDIDAEDRRLALHVGAVLVGARLDGQLAGGIADQPGPAAAEAAQGGFLDLGLEVIEAGE